jgi:ATP-dependent DNA helicase DinG
MKDKNEIEDKEKNKSDNHIHKSEILYELPPNARVRLLNGNRFIFAAYGCAVTERQTPSGAYVYEAVNLTTGAKQPLSHRKNPLSENDFVSMAAKIYNLPIRGDSFNAVDKEPEKAINGEGTKVTKLTGIANHIFKEILPMHGYAVRDKQIELTQHILDVISKRGVSLAESEVGTGKTHAYLIAALLAKRGRLNDFWLRGHYKQQSWAESAYMPVVISTSSIALQQAILEDYIPELSNILMQHGIIRTPLTAVIRKGKEHYICEKRIIAYYNSADPKTRGQLKLFLPSNMPNAPTAPFDLTDVDTLTPYMKKRICVLGGCGEGCQFHSKCRYAAYIKKANDPRIDFQITNHNYFLADTIHRANGRRPLLPHYQLVIVDEAHKLLQAARQMYGLELTDKELPSIAQEIHAITVGKSSSGVNVHRLAKKLEEQSGKLMQSLNNSIPLEGFDDEVERFSVTIGNHTKNTNSKNNPSAIHYLGNISSIAGELALAVADSRVQEYNKERKSNVLWRLFKMGEKIFALRKHTKLIYWLEKQVEGQTKTDALCAIPKDLDERLHRDLWSSGIPIILTSGTLSASGGFTRAKQTLGLNHLPERRLFTTTMPSPFDYKNNTLLYISENVPFPDNKDKNYVAAIADEIERLVIASHGRAAVLFTSYNAMGQVHAILTRRRNEGGLRIDGRPPFPLFRLERGGTHAIEKFKASGNGILLASGALWEGIDIPGDTLSMLIIVKLPFAVPDPIGDYERSLCGDMRTFKNKVIIPDMQVRLKQGDGRLVRSESDTGCVAIFDIRALEGGAYHDPVLAALPERNITSDIEVVRRFFLDKKPQNYFE